MMVIPVKYLLVLPVACFIQQLIKFKILTAKTEKEENLKQIQKNVAIGMAIAFLTFFSYMTIVINFVNLEETVDLTSPVNRILFTLEWSILILPTFFIGIARIATQRFFGSKETISGKKTQEIELSSSYLQNTLEQVVLSLSNLILLSIHLNDNQMQLIPALVCLFLCGRILFFFGYLNSKDTAGGRAIGFGLTFYPT
eukprot:gene11674-4910_t